MAGSNFIHDRKSTMILTTPGVIMNFETLAEKGSNFIHDRKSIMILTTPGVIMNFETLAVTGSKQMSTQTQKT